MSETIEVGNISPRVRYEGDGSNTEFHFSFNVFSTEDIDVYLNDYQLTTGYMVNLEAKGGVVIFDTAPQNKSIITIHRNLDFKRTTNFQEVGPFRTSKVNLEFDYQLACMEQLQENINRTVTFPPYAPTIMNVGLPMPEAGKSIIWNEAGNSLINSSIEIEKLATTYDEVMKNSALTSNNTIIVTSKTAEALKAAEDAKIYSVNVKNRSETIYTSEKNLGNVSGNLTIQVEADYFEYMATPTANTNFTFDFSKADISKIITFTLKLNQTETYTYSYNFGEGITFTWLDGIGPTPSGNYLISFRRYPNKAIIGTVIGKLS